MTNAPAIPVPVWWGGINTPPQALDPWQHMAVPQPEPDLPLARLLYPFGEALASWEINHNKGRVPASVEVMSAFGRVTTSKVVHTTVNQTVISHAHPFVGYAILVV